MPEETNTIRIRETFEITQKRLSEITGIPLGTIRNWDSRNCMPTYMTKLIWNTLVKVLDQEEE